MAYRLVGVMAVAAACLALCSAALAAETAPSDVWGTNGTWAFEPGQKLSGGVLDLRSLNEPSAGEHGFVRLSADGNSFVLGDGTPVRFWGVAADVGAKVSDEDLARHARFLARLGVNMVRVGGATSGLMPQKEGSAITDVNEQFLDDVWRTVAAMKKDGIYVRVSPFWDHGSVKYINPDWGIEGYSSGDTVNGLLFFDPTLQRGYKAWMKHLLTDVNPYTGIALKDDPALAIVQIVSEDTIFFWWTDKIKGGPRRELERRFGKFAQEKYGSIEKALAAWDEAKVDGDAPAEGRLGLYSLYNLTLWPGRGNPQRLRDQTEFMSKLERGFYTEMVHYLRDELGAKQVIGASNFGPADPVRLGGLQRWDWTPGDVIELNDFFNTNPQGPDAFWKIQAGDFFTPRSATRQPSLPTNRVQVVGHPFIISSTNWVPPNPYSTEGPVMSACYGAMNGLDGFMWFAANVPTYDTSPYMTWWTVQGSHPMPRWTISTPGFISQFPAAALIYRQGLVDPAATVVHEERTLAQLYDRDAPLIDESLDYDPAAHADEAPAGVRPLMKRASPWALLAGRVEAVYDGDPSRDSVADLSGLVDSKAGTVRTTNGELTLDHKVGLLRIDSPRAQGVVGFLKDAGGDFHLADVDIRSGNEYAGVVLVPLDGAPLARSQKVLVQVGTIAHPTGWATRAATRKVKGQEVSGREIVSTGNMPWRMGDADVELTVRNPALRQATRLDVMGFAGETVPVEAVEGALRIKLPADTLYLVLSAGKSG